MPALPEEIRASFSRTLKECGFDIGRLPPKFHNFVLRVVSRFHYDHIYDSTDRLLLQRMTMLEHTCMEVMKQVPKVDLLKFKFENDPVACAETLLPVVEHLFQLPGTD